MFMPPRTTCEADHPNPDFGYCGDVAVGFVKDDKGRDRPVCLFHRELWHIPAQHRGAHDPRRRTMKAPRLLDLFCSAGGASEGYRRAGFDVVGVDIKPQPRYPFEFIVGDALEVAARIGHEFDAIAASPPCQAHSSMRKGRWKDREHPDLVAPTRDLLRALGKPYVIENVVGAPLHNPFMLCGTMFGLGLPNGAQLRRHRLFECSFVLMIPFECAHNDGAPLGIYGGGQVPGRRYHKQPATIGVWGKPGGSSTRDEVTQYGLEERKIAMGIDWMRWDELSESIPPAYTEFIGRQLIQQVGS
jgi:DNA (cytosine-5)-methyltransferase 1